VAGLEQKTRKRKLSPTDRALAEIRSLRRALRSVASQEAISTIESKARELAKSSIRSSARHNARRLVLEAAARRARLPSGSASAEPDPDLLSRWRDKQDAPDGAPENRGAETRRCDEIIVGERHRKEYGELRALAQSISDRGLLHPIVITPQNDLICGERRLRAWQLPECRFNDQPIPVTVIDIDSVVAGEHDENNLRKPFTPSEAVAVTRALRDRIEQEAKERQREGGRSKASGKLPEAAKGETRAKLAAAVGKGARTLEKAEAVVAAAEANPALAKLVEDMDRTGRVDGPYKRLNVLKAAERIRREPPPLPGSGPYRGGVIDWPWAAEPESQDDHLSRLARGYYPYPTMSNAEIVDYARDRVRPMLAENCVVAIWIPNFHLARGYHIAVLEALGLKGVTIRTWVKSQMGQGHLLRGKTEHAVVATRGAPVIAGGRFTTELLAPADRTYHSRKPQQFYDDFERLVPAPRYFTLFETIHRGPKWDGHGGQPIGSGII
jgi:N6-adenosine-specific RNA methylase IME4